jgi:hypothetical protein
MALLVAMEVLMVVVLLMVLLEMVILPVELVHLVHKDLVEEVFLVEEDITVMEMQFL